MLALLGILTIALLFFLVMTKKASPVVALIVVPVITALLGGFTTEIFTFMTEGIQSISTTGVMFIFAILFFGILTDRYVAYWLVFKLYRGVIVAEWQVRAG